MNSYTYIRKARDTLFPDEHDVSTPVRLSSVVRTRSGCTVQQNDTQ